MVLTGKGPLSPGMGACLDPTQPHNVPSTTNPPALAHACQDYVLEPEQALPCFQQYQRDIKAITEMVSRPLEAIMVDNDLLHKFGVNPAV